MKVYIFISLLLINTGLSFYLRNEDYLPPKNTTGKGVFITYNKKGERIDKTVEEVNKKFFNKYLK